MNCILLYVIGVTLNFGIPMLGFGKSFWGYDKEIRILWFLNITVCILFPFIIAFACSLDLIARKFLK